MSFKKTNVMEFGSFTTIFPFSMNNEGYFVIIFLSVNRVPHLLKHRQKMSMDIYLSAIGRKVIIENHVLKFPRLFKICCTHTVIDDETLKVESGDDAFELELVFASRPCLQQIKNSR